MSCRYMLRAGYRTWQSASPSGRTARQRAGRTGAPPRSPGRLAAERRRSCHRTPPRSRRIQRWIAAGVRSIRGRPGRVGAGTEQVDGAAGRLNASQAGVTRVRTALEGIVKLRLTAVSDPQHGGFTAGSSPSILGVERRAFRQLDSTAGRESRADGEARRRPRGFPRRAPRPRRRMKHQRREAATNSTRAARPCEAAAVRVRIAARQSGPID